MAAPTANPNPLSFLMDPAILAQSAASLAPPQPAPPQPQTANFFETPAGMVALGAAGAGAAQGVSMHGAQAIYQAFLADPSGQTIVTALNALAGIQQAPVPAPAYGTAAFAAPAPAPPLFPNNPPGGTSTAALTRSGRVVHQPAPAGGTPDNGLSIGGDYYFIASDDEEDDPDYQLPSPSSFAFTPSAFISPSPEPSGSSPAKMSPRRAAPPPPPPPAAAAADSDSEEPQPLTGIDGLSNVLPPKRAGRGRQRKQTDAERREKRLIRNRETAAKCRKRKREEFENMEAEVKRLRTENDALRSENEALKKRAEVLAAPRAGPLDGEKAFTHPAIKHLLQAMQAVAAVAAEGTRSGALLDEVDEEEARETDEENEAEEEEEVQEARGETPLSGSDEEYVEGQQEEEGEEGEEMMDSAGEEGDEEE